MIPAPDGAAAQTTVKDEYDQAVALVSAGQYESAEKSLTVFLAKYSKTKYAPAATYGLGESFFLRGRHREAAEKYLEISTKYPQSKQAPDAMLRLGAIAGGARGARTGLRLLRRNRRQISRLSRANPGRRAAREQKAAMLSGAPAPKRPAGAARRRIRAAARRFRRTGLGRADAARRALAAARGWRQDHGRDRRPWAARKFARRGVASRTMGAARSASITVS